MKRMFLLLALMPMVLSAALLTVDDDGGMDYTLVQQAIDATADGDTVLVYPGAYYEHLDFLGKAISVMSLAITTGDTAYVSQTVLDGEGSGCVVKIVVLHMACMKERNTPPCLQVVGFLQEIL